MLHRILLASDLQELGGAVEVVRLLARHLPRERTSVTVALPAASALDRLCVELAAIGCGVERLEHAGARDVRGIREFRSVLAGGTYDLVHAHLPHSGSCRAIILASARAGTPVVATEHDPFPLSPLKKLVKRVTLRRTTCTVAISDAAREFLLQEYHLRSDHVVRIWNGIELAQVQGGAVRTPEHCELRSHAPLLLTIAALHPRKGLDVLIEAMRTVQAAAPQALALILGVGPAEAELRSLIAARGVGEHVRIAGWRDDRADLLAACDVLVQPSRREAFGLAVVEAMAAGKPVIATQVGGHIDTIEHERTGILVPPDDPAALAEAILALAADPQWRGALGAAGQERASAHFTADRMAADTAALYDGLLTHA